MTRTVFLQGESLGEGTAATRCLLSDLARGTLSLPEDGSREATEGTEASRSPWRWHFAEESRPFTDGVVEIQFANCDFVCSECTAQGVLVAPELGSPWPSHGPVLECFYQPQNREPAPCVPAPALARSLKPGFCLQLLLLRLFLPRGPRGVRPELAPSTCGARRWLQLWPPQRWLFLCAAGWHSTEWSCRSLSSAHQLTGTQLSPPAC